MSTNDIEDQLVGMFGASDVESSSPSSDSSEEEELEDGGNNSAEDEWQSEGRLQSFPFTSVGGINVGPAESPYDIFKLLFNATFMSLLVSSINTNAIKLLLENSHPHGRINEWKNIDIAELQVFLGLLFHMGHIKLNRINDYWRTDSLFQLPLKNFMSRDRFLIILRNLSFSDPTLFFSPTDPNRYTKAIFNFFNDLMKTLVNPPKNLTIDESVVLWRGRLKIRQYIQGKRHKYGVKLYVLTDTNGITQKMHMYCGSHDVDVRGQGHADKVVMLLMEDYLNLGHSLYMDNFYNSVKLAEDLLAKKTYVTGTLRANRSGNPSITKEKLSKGSILTKFNPRGVCITHYKDKRSICMISTEHNSDFVEHTNRRAQTLLKPQVIVNYNKYMKGVDRKDQMLSYYPSYNKSTRWYKKILIHVMQVMMLNSFLIYNEQKKQTDNTDQVMSFFDFRLDIVRNLLNIKNQTDRPTTSHTSKIKTSLSTEIHLPVDLPKNEKGKTKRKDCRHCLETNKRRKAALFYCPLCPKSPGLCMSCFRPYHKY